MVYQIGVSFSCYENKMQITFNDGYLLSNASKLKRYMNEPFNRWCNILIDCLYDEVGSKFELIYQGREEEYKIIKCIARESDKCVSVVYKPFILNDTIQQRLKKLSFLIEANDGLNIQKIHKKVVFVARKEVLDKYKEDINLITIRNKFCEYSFASKEYNSDKLVDGNETLIFMAESDGELNKYIANINKSCNKEFLLLDGSDDFMKNGEYIRVANGENFLNVVFETLLFGSLVEVFNGAVKQCIEKVSNKKILDELKLLKSIKPVVNIGIENTKIEKGETTNIFVTAIPANMPLPKLKYRYQFDGIVKVEGNKIFALNDGTTTITVYEEGSVDTITTFEVAVYSRNRVTDIGLNEISLNLGIGDTKQLLAKCYPEDADNIDTIVWASENPSIVSVSDSGLIKAHKRGVCRVYCQVEKVRGYCKVNVKPYLEKLALPEEFIEPILRMKVGTIHKLNCITSPIDAIDGELTYASDNYLVANVNQDGEIKAVQNGRATITIVNSTQKYGLKLRVVVFDPKQEDKPFWKKIKLGRI